MRLPSKENLANVHRKMLGRDVLRPATSDSDLAHTPAEILENSTVAGIHGPHRRHGMTVQNTGSNFRVCYIRSMLDGAKQKLALFGGIAIGGWVIVAGIDECRIDAKRHAEAQAIADEWDRTKDQQAARARAEKERLAAQDAAAQAALAALQKEQDDAKARDFAALQDASPGDRVTAVRKACTLGCDAAEVDLIEKAAHSDGERKALQNLVGRLEDERAKITEKERRSAEQRARERFADAYDTALLDQHMNPDAVRANGTTLHIEGWFCTRQFIFDFQKTTAAQARDVGFTRLSCESGLETWSASL